MRRLPFYFVALVVLAVAGCTSAGSAPSASDPPGAILVVAKDYTFDTSTLAMTAGEATLIHFTNRDSEDHDIAIFPNKDSNEPIFDGENIGHGAIVYDVPAFDAGDYYFHCTIHPNMNGTVQVTP